MRARAAISVGWLGLGLVVLSIAFGLGSASSRERRPSFRCSPRGRMAPSPLCQRLGA
jgi:hypothetical protein